MNPVRKASILIGLQGCCLVVVKLKLLAGCGYDGREEDAES